MAHYDDDHATLRGQLDALSYLKFELTDHRRAPFKRDRPVVDARCPNCGCLWRLKAYRQNTTPGPGIWTTLDPVGLQCVVEHEKTCQPPKSNA